MTAVSMKRLGFVGIPGRNVSTGCLVERVLARLIDDAETSFLHAADAAHPGPWAAALAYGNGILHGAAVLADLRDDQIDGLFTDRCGALPAELYGLEPGRAVLRSGASSGGKHHNNAPQLIFVDERTV